MDKQLDIIDSLYPDFSEYAVNSDFHHWMEYACELDSISTAVWLNKEDSCGLVEHMNKRMLKLRAGSPEHDACVDVASTLEEALPQFKGLFNYN